MHLVATAHIHMSLHIQTERKTGTIPATFSAYSRPLLTRISLWVRKYASGCVYALLLLFGKYHLRNIFIFPLGCLLLQLYLEEGDRRSGRATTKESSKQWLRSWVLISVLSGCVIGLAFCYLLNLNLMLWNIIAMLKFSYPFQGALIP